MCCRHVVNDYDCKMQLRDVRGVKDARHVKVPRDISLSSSHPLTTKPQKQMAYKQGGVAYAYASDPEAGTAYSRRIARRLITRRGKIAIAAVTFTALVFFFFQPLSYGRRPPPHEWAENGEHAGHADKPAGSDWGWTNPFKSTPPKFVEADYAEYIAPMHPDVASLPSPESIYPDMDIKEHLKSVKVQTYPDQSLRDIISPPEDFDRSAEIEAERKAAYHVPEGSFAAEWEGPSDWDGPRETLRKVQWEGFRGGRDRWETEEQKELREKRRDAVKRAFVHGWQAYKDYAWGRSTLHRSYCAH